MPDIAQTIIGFDEGPINLDRVYGAPDPANVKDFKSKIPAILEVSREHLTTISNLLANYQKKIIKVGREHGLSHGGKGMFPEIDIPYLVNSINKLPENDRSRANLLDITFKAAGLLEITGPLNAQATSIINNSLSGISRPGIDVKDSVEKYRQAIEAIVGKNKGQLVDAIMEAVPKDYTDGRGSKKIMREFEGRLKKIDPTIIKEVVPEEMLRGLSKEIGAHTANGAEFMKEEEKHSRLLLRTVNEIVGRGTDKTADVLFAGGAKTLELGSRPLVVVMNYTPKIVENLMVGTGPNESTTGYTMIPSASINEAANKYDGYLTNIRRPVFGLDVRAVDALKDSRVTNSQLLKWSENYLRMSAAVDHDYLHVITNPRQDFPYHDGKILFLSNKIETVGTHIAVTGDYLEDFTMSLHAKVLNKLFAEPKRKEAALSTVVESYVQLAEMQKTALANAPDAASQDRVNRAITYLAEIEAHRVFRAFSPDDQALQTPVKVKNSDVKISVAAAMESVNLVSPKELQVELAGKTAIERLTRQTEYALGDKKGDIKTYRAIHTKDEFPMIRHGEPETRDGKTRVSAMSTKEILVSFMQDLQHKDQQVAEIKRTARMDDKEFTKFMEEEGAKLRLNGSAVATANPLAKLPEQAAQEVKDVKTALASQQRAANVSAGIGTGLGATGVYQKLINPNSNYHKDVADGGSRADSAEAALAGNLANLGMGGFDLASLIHGGGTAVRTVTGNLALPVALFSSVFDTNAAVIAKDGHRAVETLGGTYSGIACGIGGAAAGALFGPPGMIIGGLGGAVGCGYVGGELAKSLAGDWVDEKLKHIEDPFGYINTANAHGLGPQTAKTDATKKAPVKGK